LVVIGGALVIPGDVVIGDGVLIVPRAQARQVGEYARKVLDGDKASRRSQHEQMGMELDQSVQ
jgi:regulator of RNase E activity RraA